MGGHTECPDFNLDSNLNIISGVNSHTTEGPKSRVTIYLNYTI
jgi:hypothetical protein